MGVTKKLYFVEMLDEDEDYHRWADQLDEESLRYQIEHRREDDEND